MVVVVSVAETSCRSENIKLIVLRVGVVVVVDVCGNVQKVESKFQGIYGSKRHHVKSSWTPNIIKYEIE